MRTPFQHYDSLGDNCEVAFQFRRILDKDSSSFFSWNATPFSALKSLLRRRFARILQPENLSRHGDGSLVSDASHGYYLHSPFSTPEPHDDPEFEAHLGAMRDKTAYLIAKFIDVARSGERVAYFYKTDEPEARTNSLELRDILDEYHQGDANYVIILMQSADKAEPDWDEARIANRYLTRFAPWYDAPDGHVSSYDKLFLGISARGTDAICRLLTPPAPARESAAPALWR